MLSRNFFGLSRGSGSGPSGFCVACGSYWDVGYGYRSSVSVDKFNFSTEGRTAGTNLLSGRTNGAGAGNSTVSVFTSGLKGRYPAYTVITDKYDYGTDATTAGTSTTGYSRYYNSAFQSTTVGFYAGGYSPDSATVFKYTFSTDAVSAGTSLPDPSGARRAAVSSSNDTLGVVIGGYSTNVTVKKYTMSTDACVGGTSLGSTTHQGTAFSSTTEIVVSMPTTYLSTQKYNYAGDSWTAGSSFTVTTRLIAGGASCSIYGVSLGGGGQSASEKYSFGSDAVTSFTSISVNRDCVMATSSSHGGFA